MLETSLSLDFGGNQGLRKASLTTDGGQDRGKEGGKEGRKQASKQRTGDGEIVASKGSAVIASHPSRPPPTESASPACPSEICLSKFHHL